jgi:hypothetical protein
MINAGSFNYRLVLQAPLEIRTAPARHARVAGHRNIVGVGDAARRARTDDRRATRLTVEYRVLVCFSAEITSHHRLRDGRKRILQIEAEARSA